jgi:hypothetical protein
VALACVIRCRSEKEIGSHLGRSSAENDHGVAGVLCSHLRSLFSPHVSVGFQGVDCSGSAGEIITQISESCNRRVSGCGAFQAAARRIPGMIGRRLVRGAERKVAHAAAPTGRGVTVSLCQLFAGGIGGTLGGRKGMNEDPALVGKTTGRRRENAGVSTSTIPRSRHRGLALS